MSTQKIVPQGLLRGAEARAEPGDRDEINGDYAEVKPAHGNRMIAFCRTANAQIAASDRTTGSDAPHAVRREQSASASCRRRGQEGSCGLRSPIPEHPVAAQSRCRRRRPEAPE